MADHGVLTTGFVRKTESECFDEIIEEARATIQPDLDNSEDTAHGAQAAIVASKAAELWEVAEDGYNAHSANASGDALDIICELTGTTRHPATYSTVIASVRVDPGTYAAGDIAATVDGDPNARFVSTAPVTNLGASAGWFSVAMQADTPGPVRAPAGLLSVLDGPPAGVLEIENPADADLGSEQESDGELRLRRIQELAGAGSTTVDATRARLAKLPGVTEVQVYTNRGNAVNALGLPPHSMEAVVLGGTDEDVALTIWGSLPLGIEDFGSDSLEISDEEGNAQTVHFSRPTGRRLWVRVTITTNPTSYPGNQAVQQAIADFSDGTMVLTSSSGDIVLGTVEVGGTVYGSKLSAAALSVAGVLSVVSVEISADAGFSAPVVNYQLGTREYLGHDGSRGIDAADVTVVI
jgi:hypothetical protein